MFQDLNNKIQYILFAETSIIGILIMKQNYDNILESDKLFLYKYLFNSFL